MMTKDTIELELTYGKHLVKHLAQCTYDGKC